MMSVDVIVSTPYPQTVSYITMRGCKHRHLDWQREMAKSKAEGDARVGALLIKYLLGPKGQRGHYGPLEHPVITFYCDDIPAPVLGQIRTHRIASFDAFSWREGCVEDAKKILEKNAPVTNFFHVSNTLGESVPVQYFRDALAMYVAVAEKFGTEAARDLLPAGYLTSFSMSVNARSLMHILDLRLLANAQSETVFFAELLLEKFVEWMPEIANWYISVRAGKSFPAP